jgi:hypothetical protein
MTYCLGFLLAVCTVLSCAGAASKKPSSPADAVPLVIRTDSITYRIQPDTEYPSHYRLRLSVRLENRTRDTVWLAYPCQGGPSPQRYFLRARDLSTTVIGMILCTSSAGSTEPKPSAFPVAPTIPVIDTIDARIFRSPFNTNETGLRAYVGTYRLAYSRWIRHGFLRRSWTIAPLAETMSNEFHVDSTR